MKMYCGGTLNFVIVIIHNFLSLTQAQFPTRRQPLFPQATTTTPFGNQPVDIDEEGEEIIVRTSLGNLAGRKVLSLLA